VKSEDIKDSRDYGYGYWMRFMTRHPAPMISGKKEAWYFVSRLTRNDPYGDIALGDRLLCLWLG
jgi:hypothetical protein